MNKKRVGNFIKQLRKEKCYSQEQLSNKLYDMDVVVSTNAISQWERGETVPDVSNLLTLADLFNVSVDELLDGKRYEKVDYKELYFTYNNEWLHKYSVNTNVNLYEMNQNQKILIKNRFNDLLRIRVENYFTKQEEEEFSFLVKYFFNISDYLLDKENETTSNLNIHQRVSSVLNQCSNMSVEERIWELKKLIIPNTDIDLNFHDFSVENKYVDNPFFDKRFKELEFWEKDIIFASLQSCDPICVHDDMWGSSGLIDYKKKHGEEYNEDEIVRSKIKYLLNNGACINRQYINFIKQIEEERRTIDRVEYLYNLCEKPIEFYTSENGVERKFVVENNSRNRFFINHYYKIFILDKDISLEDAFNFFANNDDIPDELLMIWAKIENIDINQTKEYLAADIKQRCGNKIKMWNEAKAIEKEIDEGKKELKHLVANLKSGINKYKVTVNHEVGGSNWLEVRDYCHQWNQDLTYEEIKNKRDINSTKDLLKNIDNLTLKDIREKYFLKEVYCDEE